ncbi:BamA/TamA family outer membrane protein [Aquiflexum sp.]|uniref:BamA/TamA family outer membrane protein n=1 Tax=Aquiflexum sp. TaxID=1872584 RepID=UPI003592F047
MKRASLLILFSLLAYQKVKAQVANDSLGNSGRIEKLFDFGDLVIERISGKNWAFIPALVYSPETSLGLGLRAIRVFRYKEKEPSTLRPSSLPITFLYTLNNQAIFTTEINLWANDNKEYFNTRLELSNFPFKYYGIGNKPDILEGEPYTTRFAYIHLNYQRRIAPGLYFGPRYEFRVDDIFRRVHGGILETTQVPGYDGQRISGLGLVFNHDTRDNIFQPTKGWLNRLEWMGYASFLGSNFVFNQYTLDFRKYFKTNEKQVLVLQSWWSSTTGNPPFQHLSLIGGSDRMRGFFEGRYRDNHAMVHQAEYRLRLYRNLGMVLFGHTGQVAAQTSDFNWNRFKYGAGFGFRYRLNQEGLNIRLDFAFGDQRAFYFGLNEVI